MVFGTIISFAVLFMIGFFALLVVGEVARAVYVRANTAQQGRDYARQVDISPKRVTGEQVAY